jgi:protein-L-isoaspartate(D-aspartate) O-methyltransferase
MMNSESLRRHMVDSQLRTSGVNTPWITQAMAHLPREQFAGAGQAGAAYTDRPVWLGKGRVLNPPAATGQLLQAAAPEAGDRVLLVGAATGYLAALLAPRVANLIALEEVSEFAVLAEANVPAVEVVTGPLRAGYIAGAPYSLIVIDGAIDELPQAIVDQLIDGGRIVTGLREGAALRLAMGVKHGSHLALRAFADTEIAPLPGFERVREFEF